MPHYFIFTALPESLNCRANVVFGQLWTFGIYDSKLKEKEETEDNEGCLKRTKRNY